MSIKTMSRRMMLKALPAAPIAAQEAVGVAVVGNAAAQIPTLMAYPSPGGYAAKLLGLKKLGILPDWLLRRGKKGVAADARRLDPDVAALRSMSLSAKIAMQTRINFRRSVDGFEQDLLDEIAQEKFYQQT